MKMNTQSRVAIAAILDVAVNGRNKPVPLTDISVRQRVSLSYLEQMFKKLRQKGFITSQRGPGGGYRLNQGLAAMSVADIINAVDRETFDRSPCNGTGHCQETPASVSNSLWCRVNDHLYDYLRSVTLESILEDARNAANSRETSVAPATVSRVERTSLTHEERPEAAIAQVGPFASP